MSKTTTNLEMGRPKTCCTKVKLCIRGASLSVFCPGLKKTDTDKNRKNGHRIGHNEQTRQKRTKIGQNEHRIVTCKSCHDKKYLINGYFLCPWWSYFTACLV